MGVDTIAGRLEQIRNRIDHAAARSGRSGRDITLIAVTKTHSADVVQELVDAGVTHVGENRVQELSAKVPLVSGDVVWHMIGHLQRNKVNRTVACAQWVQSVASVRLAQALGGSARERGVRVRCLVEVNMTTDVTKTGAPRDEVLQICEAVAAEPALELRGLMTIGPLDGTPAQVRDCFSQVRELSLSLGTLCPQPELSMGMSGDFELAVEEGATMVRIGYLLVGNRGGDRKQ